VIPIAAGANDGDGAALHGQLTRERRGQRHRTTRFDPSAAGRTALERRYIHGHRWCDAADIADLAAAGQTVYPLQLGELLATANGVSAADVPAEPLAIR